MTDVQRTESATARGVASTRAGPLLPGGEPIDWPADGLESPGCCPVCGARDRRCLHTGLRDRVFHRAPGQWTLYACGACGIAYLDPRPTRETLHLAYASYYTHALPERPALDRMSSFERLRRILANGYRNWRYGTDDRPSSVLGVPLAFLMPAARAALDTDFRHLPRRSRGGRVLDVGFGSGAFLRWAASAGWAVEGVDPDPHAVATARAQGFTVRQGTIEDVQTTPEPFDVVTLSHVLEHVHDPRGLIEGIRRVLRPGGHLWLDTPNIASIGHRRFGPAWLGLDAPRHLVIFNHHALDRLLASLGFTVVRRVSRFEVCRLTFAISERMAADRPDPLNGGPFSMSARLAAHAASCRIRLDPQGSEFITLIARKGP